MKLFNLVMTFLCLTLFSANVAAAVFLKIEGIDGESTDSTHKEWIDVLSIDWGMHTPTTTGQSRRRGSAIVEDVRISMDFNLASPQLMQALTLGRVLRTAHIEFLPTGRDEKTLPYLKYHLTNVRITGYQTSAGEDDPPVDQISFRFEEIEVEYVSPATGEESMFQYSREEGR